MGREERASPTMVRLGYATAASRRRRRLRWVRRGGFVLVVVVAVMLGRWVGPPIWERYRLLRLQRELAVDLPEGQIVFSMHGADYRVLPGQPPRAMGRYQASQGATSHKPRLPQMRRGGFFYVGWVPGSWWEFAPALTGGSEGRGLVLARMIHRPDGTPRIVVIRLDEEFYSRAAAPYIYVELIAPGTPFTLPKVINRTNGHPIEADLRILAPRLDGSCPGRMIVPMSVFSRGEFRARTSPKGADSYVVTRFDSEIKVSVNDEDEIDLVLPKPPFAFRPTSEMGHN
jgi:hypothetical protein